MIGSIGAYQLTNGNLLTATVFSCGGLFNAMRGFAIMTLILIILMFVTSAMIAISAVYTAR
jgi:hypothetical protein